MNQINPKIFKAYDIRGIYPNEIDAQLAYRIGQAYLKVVNPSGPIAVGMDVRKHSQELKKFLIKGLIDGGATVIDLGLISTEMLYFAVGNYGLEGGIQVTASHNTAEYNGFKMTRSKAYPISSDNGIFQIRDLVLNNEDKITTSTKGFIKKKDILDDFARFVCNFVNKEKIKSFKIAYNPNFGFEGIVLKKIKDIGNFNFELIGLNHIPDGTFPKGQPDPLRDENRHEFVEFIKNNNVDLGVSWDADADRVFFFTGKGDFINPYYTNALLASHMLSLEKGGKIIYDPRYTWAFIDLARNLGGEAILDRVGHSFIKARMKKENAIFSGESSGHVYFRDFWYADTGIIPFLIMLEIISIRGKIEDLVKPFLNKYFISGEINFQLNNKDDIFLRIKEKYFKGNFLTIDGLSVEFPDWRMNVRISNTESLLRVNIEGINQEIVNQKKEEIAKLVTL